MPVFAVETHLLFEVVWISLAAGVGISFVFSWVIVGTAKAGDARRDGRPAATVLYTLLAVLAFAVFAAGIAIGVHAMIQR